MAGRDPVMQFREPINSDGEGTLASRRSSGQPLDLEKGMMLRRPSEFSEDSGKVQILSPTSGIMQPVSPMEHNEKGGDKWETDSHDESRKRPTARKHWRPSKIWFIVVFLGLVACWIPAILAWTRFPNARIWGVKLLFWSIWLSIFWAGWWFALVFSWIVHRILLALVRLLAAFRLKRYVNWLEYLHGYFALVAWTLALWITWVPLIDERQLKDGSEDGASSRSVRAVDLAGRLFFALACCVGILFVEKIAVQWIALKFHERSYRRRIEAQQEAVHAFKTLYAAIRANPLSAGVITNLPEKRLSQKKQKRTPSKGTLGTWTSSMYPTISRQQFNYHHRKVERAATSSLRTAFTDVTGQIFGTGILPGDEVASAFHKDGSRKMRLLAEDVWLGIGVGSGLAAAGGTRVPLMQKSALEKLLSGANAGAPKAAIQKQVEQIWKVLTGSLPQLSSINESEFTTRCSDLHAEQRRLEETMNDLQNVVGRLDDILMLFWVIGSLLVFAVALEAELKTLIFGAGTAFVGASWLLKDAASEVLASIIFLFSKHPFDVEDMVIINGKNYTVVEMRLLSTVFYNDESIQVQAPNSLLNTCFIQNLRRSPATSEPFTVEVSDKTTEDQLERFKEHMLEFLKSKPKDYRHEFDVVIKELSCTAQKLVLATEIRYNNNWENDDRVRAKRRNAWICRLRDALHDANIEGPGMPAMKIIRETENDK